MTDKIREPVTQQQETVTKQKNPLRIEKGKILVEHKKRKKDLNEQITKQRTNLSLIQILMYMSAVSVCLD